MAWNPTTILRFTKGISSSAYAALVETDAGPGYLKGMGGPEGPHSLACEWIGTHLAKWFKLPTFEITVIDVTDADEIPFMNPKGERVGLVQPGPAFISRRESGETWSGDGSQLNRLANPQDISRLVVFDTWTLNCDRHSWPEGGRLGKPRINRNNVFLSEEAPPGQFLLKAMDHTHCFTCGRELKKNLATLGRIRDERLFGLFPEFQSFLDRNQIEQAIADLRKIDNSVVQPIMRGIPQEWEVSREVLAAFGRLILERAVFVADTITDRLWPQKALDFGTAEDARETT